MIRCKPLLGTYVEISIDEIAEEYAPCKANIAIDAAFSAIELVQQLMSFHNSLSELSIINRSAHTKTLQVHEWTYQVLATAVEIYHASKGLFNCGVGDKLISSGILPSHEEGQSIKFGGLEDLVLLESNQITSKKPLRLDLGGIAKGFAVDKAVETLKALGIISGSVNAGGDLRVFGSNPKEIQVRSPANPNELIQIGSLENGSIASTSTYFINGISPIINPIEMKNIEIKGSYSILAPECIYADALTKVLAISQDLKHPCFKYFSAQALRIAA
jgi:FAD:protein FMN transferase